MRYIIQALLLLLFAQSSRTASAQSSVLVSGCNFAGLDFSSFAGSDIVATNPLLGDFALQICGVLDSHPECTHSDSNAGACMLDTTPNTTVIGDWNTNVHWDWITLQDKSFGVWYKMVKERACYAYGTHPVNFTTAVWFECSNDDQITVYHYPGGCYNRFTIPTRQCTVTARERAR